MFFIYYQQHASNLNVIESMRIKYSNEHVKGGTYQQILFAFLLFKR